MSLKRCLTKALRLLLIACLVTSMAVPAAVAQDLRGGSLVYRIAPDDVLVLRVPQRQDLNRDMAVAADGTVTMPLVGSIEVGGLTAQEAETKIFQAMRRFYPSLAEIEVTLQASDSQVIYVLGQVGRPGKYNFIQSPSVWEAIREAGGPSGTASLDQVRIVKDLAKGGGSRVVDVQHALEGGSVEKLPKLDPGDTVIIPEQEKSYTGASGVDVFGAVVKPGMYRLQARGDLMSALLMAGGPTDRAALSEITIVRAKDDGTMQTIAVDFTQYLKNGDVGANPTLRVGDSVSIPEMNAMAYQVKNDLGLILNIITTGIALTTLIVTINNTK